MKEKKNIDRIFQEKFRDFEQDPGDGLWERIAEKLDEKDHRKGLIIPLWLKWSGAAAILALVIGSLVFFNQAGPNSVEGTTPISAQTPKTEENETQEQNNRASTSRIVNNIPDAVKPDKATSPKNQLNKPNTSIKGSASEVKLVRAEKSTVKDRIQQRMVLADGLKENPENYQLSKAGYGQFKILPLDSLFGVENQLAHLEKDLETHETITDEKTSNKNRSKRLQLSSFAAPVFYKNLGSGNELSGQFEQNPTSNEPSFSYGVHLAYEISDKVKLRTGISKLSMNSQIAGISYSPSALSPGLDNISSAGQFVQIRNDIGGNMDSMERPGVQLLSSSIYTPGEISQHLGFVEIPIEIEYALVKGRIDLNLIAGGSGLLLDQNQLEIISGDTSIDLGKANNINKTSFSTNLGMGLEYRLTNQLGLSLEPIFKYQINTFENVSNVRPVNFGVYSGIKLKF